MNELVLDARLQALLKLVGGAAVVADIGCDHGKLACALLLADPTRHVLLADISEDSLAKARRLLAEAGALDRATFAVADGLAALAALKQPAEVIVLAGLGAKTIRQVLTAGRAAIGGARLILQPNLDAPQLRAWLADSGFAITREDVAQAGGRFYQIIEAAATNEPSRPLTEKQCVLGVHLPNERAPEYLAYLRWRRQVLRHVQAGLRRSQAASCAATARQAGIAQELAWIEEVLA